MMNQSNTFDQEIIKAMHFRRWLDIKVCLKQNEFWTEKKKTDKGYDPTQQYRLHSGQNGAILSAIGPKLRSKSCHTRNSC
jgi:hypothetical protein